LALRTPKTVVMSLGGSLIVPDAINTDFLREFVELIRSYVKKGFRFVIVCGGGRTTRVYQKAAAEVSKLTNDDLDWIGIHATRLNAQLIKALLVDIAEPKIIKNPTQKFKMKKAVVIASGWKPGFSTDYDAIMLAKQLKVPHVINLSGSIVHDKDPSKFSDAKPLDEIKWKDFFAIVGDSWSPGLNMPFDPIASKAAVSNKISVFVLGPDLSNLESYLLGKHFKGTIIR
jgi:uridylate kinase